MAYTLVKRVGGKIKIRKWIIENLPAHKIFCEPFGGSFAVGLGLNKVDRLIYNDLDQHIYNFFNVLRYKGEEFTNQVLLTPYSMQEYENACAIIDDKENKPWKKITDIEWARLYLIYNRQSFGGKEDGTWCVSKKGENPVKTWKGLPDLALKTIEKLKDAFITNEDYKDCLKKWDSEETTFYLDPPYEHVEDDYYKVNKENGFNHVEMAQELLKIKGSVVVSYYYSQKIIDMYPGFQVITKDVVKHIQTKDIKDKVTEMLLIKHSDWAKNQNTVLYGDN